MTTPNDPYNQPPQYGQQPGYGSGQYPPAPQYGAPGYGPPPGYGNYPPPSPGTNGMAIAGFVLSFFCSILGLIFSIIGLNQCNQRNQGGKGLAIAGIVISVASMIFGIIYVAALRK